MMLEKLQLLLNDSKLEYLETVQSLWSGYGEVARCYIPVTIQDAGFRVLERFQYKAQLCSNGHSRQLLLRCSNVVHPCTHLTSSCNEVVGLLKRFFDGFKRNLCSVINLNCDCMDAGSRATQDAKAENNHSLKLMTCLNCF
jgi:hypothetical protein